MAASPSLLRPSSLVPTVSQSDLLRSTPLEGGASDKGEQRLVSRGKIVTTPTLLLRRRNHRERAATRTVRPSDAETQKRLTRMECEARARSSGGEAEEDRG